MAETVAIVSAVTALLAVLLGPLVAMWTTQRQSRVTVLSANRQAWINTLRDLIAEYISITGLIHAGDWSSRTEIEFDQKMERLALLSAKVRLMLNPKEEDHQRLGQITGDLLRSTADHGRTRGCREQERRSEGPNAS